MFYNAFPKLHGVLVNLRELSVNDAQDISHIMNYNISKYLYEVPDSQNRFSNNRITKE
jgi:hypothetical protein